MHKTFKKSRLHSNTHKPEIKQELKESKPNLPPNLQAFKQKLLPGSGFVEIK